MLHSRASSLGIFILSHHGLLRYPHNLTLRLLKLNVYYPFCRACLIRNWLLRPPDAQVSRESIHGRDLRHCVATPTLGWCCNLSRLICDGSVGAFVTGDRNTLGDFL